MNNKILRKYINEKLQVLKQLQIRINHTQKMHMMGLHSEIAVDNYARDLILA